MSLFNDENLGFLLSTKKVSNLLISFIINRLKKYAAVYMPQKRMVIFPLQMEM